MGGKVNGETYLKVNGNSRQNSGNIIYGKKMVCPLNHDAPYYFF